MKLNVSRTLSLKHTASNFVETNEAINAKGRVV